MSKLFSSFDIMKKQPQISVYKEKKKEKEKILLSIII